MIYTINSDILTVQVNSIGAEVISVKNNGGKEFLWQADERYWGSHAPILFPICGRLLNAEYSYKKKNYGLPLPGFAHSTEFSISHVSTSEITLVLRSNAETLSMYPFDFELSVKLSVIENTLKMNVSVKNESNETMPYMIGWHPGFVIDGIIDDYSISFKNGQRAVRHNVNERLFLDAHGVDFPLENGIFLPTEKEIYKVDTVILTSVGSEVALSRNGTDKIRMSQSDNLPYYAIWKAPHSEAEYICIEPWSDIPADGSAPECFEDRKMSRLTANASENYFFSVEFID